MLSRPHRRPQGSTACNDNVHVLAGRAAGSIRSGILAVAARSGGPIALTHLADGVLMIVADRSAEQSPRAAAGARIRLAAEG
ncbi:MAG TPA: hypothetical protein VHG30_18375 [Microvirga sp.]|jgi:hypothetical protein|nr:hypothetical protein [Microvirga sp.]